MKCLVTCLTLVLLASHAFAAEITLRDGRTVAYDSLECDPKNPKTCFVLRQGDTITSLRLSEIAPEQIPADAKKQLDAYVAEQKQIGLMLFEDEWIDRNGHLLKTSPDFAYPKKLRPLGGNRFTLDNRTAERITIGIRPIGDREGQERGLELVVAGGKTKTIQLPDGEYHILLVSETEGDAELAVGRSDPVKLDKHHYTLVHGAKEGGMNITPVGRIAVPKELRR